MTGICWKRVLAGATSGVVPIPGELAGYIALGIVDALGERHAQVLEADVHLGTDGRISLSRLRPSSASESDKSLRRLLAQLLQVCRSSPPALKRIAAVNCDESTVAFAKELKAALVPVNRSAARRALSRLCRELSRVSEDVGGDCPAEGMVARAPTGSGGAVAPDAKQQSIPETESVAPQPSDGQRIVDFSEDGGGCKRPPSAEGRTPQPIGTSDGTAQPLSAGLVGQLVASVVSKSSLETSTNAERSIASVPELQAPEAAEIPLARTLAIGGIGAAIPTEVTDVDCDSAGQSYHGEVAIGSDAVAPATPASPAVIDEARPHAASYRETTLVMAPVAPTRVDEHTLRLEAKQIEPRAASHATRQVLSACVELVEPSIAIPLVRLRRAVPVQVDLDEYCEESLSALAPDVDWSGIGSPDEGPLLEGVPADESVASLSLEEALRSDVPPVAASALLPDSELAFDLGMADTDNRADEASVGGWRRVEPLGPLVRAGHCGSPGSIEDADVHAVSVHECVVCESSAPSANRFASFEATLVLAGGPCASVPQQEPAFPLVISDDHDAATPAASVAVDLLESTEHIWVDEAFEETSVDTVLEISDEEICYWSADGDAPVQLRVSAEDGADEFVASNELWIDIDCSDDGRFEMVAPRVVPLEELMPLGTRSYAYPARSAEHPVLVATTDVYRARSTPESHPSLFAAPIRRTEETHYGIEAGCGDTRASVNELVDSFGREPLWSEGELCESLRELAGLDSPSSWHAQAEAPKSVETSWPAELLELEPTRRLGQLTRRAG